MNLKPEEISSIIKEEIKNYESKLETVGVGTVLDVGDGIAHVYGLDDAMSNELLEFPNDVYGMALNLEEDNVGVVLLGDEKKIVNLLKEFEKISLDVLSVKLKTPVSILSSLLLILELKGIVLTLPGKKYTLGVR
jgi:F0F1-type ATP synthase alpha subunit